MMDVCWGSCKHYIDCNTMDKLRGEACQRYERGDHDEIREEYRSREEIERELRWEYRRKI